MDSLKELQELRASARKAEYQITCMMHENAHAADLLERALLASREDQKDLTTQIKEAAQTLQDIEEKTERCPVCFLPIQGSNTPYTCDEDGPCIDQHLPF